MCMYEYRQTDYRVFMGRQKTQNNQHSIEEEERSWRTDTT